MKEIPNKVSALDILSAFQSMTFVRHGNAEKIKQGKDADRSLSALGKAQAMATYDKFQSLNIEHDLVVSSPLQRAMQTAMIVESGKLPVPLPELRINSDDEEDPLSVMFAKLMYAPLEKYYLHELNHHLKVWAHGALKGIVVHALKHGGKKRVLVAGHAVANNAIIEAFCEIMDGGGNSYAECQTLRAANFRHCFDEAQAVQLEFRDNGQEDADREIYVDWRQITPELTPATV